MAIEEAIKILTDYMGGKIDPESTELYHAVELAVDILESQPSLPSNLDEAAKKIAYDVCEQLPNGTEKDSIVYYAILAAKAGTKWMAGQGETITGIITKVGDKLDVETTEYLIPEESEFERGDKVIMQIRKEQ